MFTLAPWLIWITPLAGALLTPVLARIHSKVRDYAAVAFSLAAAILATYTALTVATGDYQVEWLPSFRLAAGGSPLRAGVSVDPLSMFMINIVAWVSFLIMVYSLGYMKGDDGLTRYWFFMNLFIGNMLLLVLADNLLMMFFGWEGVGLCSYALIGHYYKDQQEYWVGTPGDQALGIPQAYPPSHAGMKAFVVTRIGDIALLIAIFLIYAYAGTFNYNELASKLSGGGNWAASLARLGLLVPTAILFFGGPIGKSAQFPLQEWLPEAMAGPTSVSALIHAATMVKAGVFLTGRMGPVFYAALAQFGQLTPFFGTIAWVGVITAFLAATQATVQRELKKVLAYSTVSQIGYMMLGLGVAGLGSDFLLGYTAGLFHVLSHAVFKASMFLAAGWVLHVAKSRFMDEMGGLSQVLRLTTISMFIAGFSLMGIPPLSGFWTKDLVLFAAYSAGQFILYALALATVLLTGYYTMRMLGMIFTGKPSQHLQEAVEHGAHVHEADLVMLVPYFLLAIGSVAIGVAFTFPFIRDQLSGYLGRTILLPTATSPVAVQTSSVLGLSLEWLLTIVSVVVAVTGAAIGYYRHFGGRHPFTLKMGTIQHFVFERLYLNAIYYKVFVNGMVLAAHALYRYVELGIWDRLNLIVPQRFYRYSEANAVLDTRVVDGAVTGIATSGSRLSNLLRRLQTGVTEQYVLGFAVGIFLLLLYMIFVIGAS